MIYVQSEQLIWDQVDCVLEESIDELIVDTIFKINNNKNIPSAIPQIKSEKDRMYADLIT